MNTCPGCSLAAMPASIRARISARRFGFRLHRVRLIVLPVYHLRQVRNQMSSDPLWGGFNEFLDIVAESRTACADTDRTCGCWCVTSAPHRHRGMAGLWRVEAGESSQPHAGEDGKDVRITIGKIVDDRIDRLGLGWPQRRSCDGSSTASISLSLFDSTHQHRVFTVVRAIECRQSLPAFRREPRDIGVSDVAKHFRGIRWFNRCVGCGCDRRRSEVIAIEHVPRVHLALAGFLAGEIGVMHVLQPLGQDMDTTKAACSVHAIKPISCVQERRRQQEHD